MTYYQRNLPHWHPEGRAIFLTWRLHGSLPSSFVHRLRTLSKAPGKQFLEADERLDAGLTRPRWLSDPEIAGYAEDAIERGAELGCFLLHAYVVMPNHVHLLLEPHVPLPRITMGIKGASARDANRMLGRAGKPFWQDESFDHWVRSGAQLDRIRSYIHGNPVKAGFVKHPADWPWSSARTR